MVEKHFSLKENSTSAYNLEDNKAAKESEKMTKFAPLYDSFAGFYTRNIYMRVRDAFNRPINSVPGTWKLSQKI